MIKLIALYFLLFMAVVVLQLLQVPTFILFIVTTSILIAILYVTLKPILFEKDINKILDFLRKSKNPSYQFLLLYFEKKYDEAEAIIPAVRPKKAQIFHQIAILGSRNQWKEAKKLALGLKDSQDKYYYLTLIGIEIKDKALVEEYKPKITKVTNRDYIHLYEMVNKGKKKEALALINKRIDNTKGFQLLMDVQLKNEILDKK